ncbi:immunoglobulin domain-containing protein [Leptolyngbya sp. 15MV]|nr:immunoglobulin domain-containing protein [Leptolyngbya sp. 15MV]
MHGGLTANAPAPAAAFRFNPTGNGAWIPMSSNVGLARYNHTITNTGNTMVIAGGIISPCSFGNSGLIFRTTDFFTTAGFTDQHAVQTHGAFYRSAGDTLHLVAGSLIETNCNFVLNNGTSDSALFPNVNGTNQIRTLQANPFSARNNIGLADDFVANRVVLFGGASLNNFPSPTGLLGDTWIRNPAGTWTLLNTTPGQAPVPRRAFNAMVFDSVRNQILLFGGHNGEPLGDTWVLTWTTVITAQPKSIASPGPTPVGANAILRVAADGPSALTYQWRRNGVPITNGINPNGSAYLGANTDTLQISGVTWEDDTNYDVVINSACGSITSNPVRLRVASPLCYSNCDGSRSAEGLPTLSPADFVCFLNRYRNAFTSTPEAVAYVDCNSDGSISPADFSCFLTKYRAGCP